jgi:GNAT superfamily N-acetyltransferase
MTAFEIVRLSPDDWQAYRELRLAALEDAPWAFGSTFAREQRHSETDYRARLQDRPTFAARLDDRLVGLVSGLLSDEREAIELISMWVDPQSRGKGVGDALVGAVLNWAREQRFNQVRLWVAEGNDPAERLYARNGFIRTGEIQPIRPEDPSRLEYGMVCKL